MWGKEKQFYGGEKKWRNFKISTTVPSSECIAACIVHLEGHHVDYERRYNDLINMDYPLWFVDLENYEPGDESVEMIGMFLDLKVNVKLRRRVDKDGVLVYISINDSHPNISKHV